MLFYVERVDFFTEKLNLQRTVLWLNLEFSKEANDVLNPVAYPWGSEWVKIYPLLWKKMAIENSLKTTHKMP